VPTLGSVRKYKVVKEREFYAIKSCLHQEEDKLNRLVREYGVLKMLKHDHIVSVVGVWLGTKGQKQWGVVLPWLDYTLKAYTHPGPIELAISQRLDATCARSIIDGLSGAIKYLMTQNVCHYDLKPTNIMFATENPGHPFLIDIGISKEEFISTTSAPIEWDLLGPQRDIFSLGLIFFEVTIYKKSTNIVKVAWKPIFKKKGPAIKGACTKEEIVTRRMNLDSISQRLHELFNAKPDTAYLGLIQTMIFHPKLAIEQVLRVDIPFDKEYEYRSLGDQLRVEKEKVARLQTKIRVRDQTILTLEEQVKQLKEKVAQLESLEKR
jgi:serine/threonine protein kinase